MIWVIAAWSSLASVAGGVRIQLVTLLGADGGGWAGRAVAWRRPAV
ncbi:MAG: hypothetical protein ACRDOK_29725 [Streptosporangiaceae bacterium]